MFTFRSITPFYSFNRAPRVVRRQDGNETVITKVAGLPIKFEKSRFTTDDDATAEFIRKNALFGKEIFEVTEEPAPVAENGTLIVEASTKNEMIEYLVTKKGAEVSLFAGMGTSDVEAFGLTLGVTFAKPKAEDPISESVDTPANEELPANEQPPDKEEPTESAEPKKPVKSKKVSTK